MMRASPPHRRIHALDIDGTFKKLRENFVLREIGRNAPKPAEDLFRDLLLDHVPMCGAFL